METQISIQASILALTCILQCAELSQTEHKVGDNTVKVWRNPSGQFASKNGNASTKSATGSETKSNPISAYDSKPSNNSATSFFNSVVNSLNIDKISSKLSTLSQEAQDGFKSAFLSNDWALNSLVGMFSGKVREGVEAGRNLIDSTKGLDIKAAASTFKEKASDFIKSAKDNAPAVALGFAIVGFASWGVLDLVTAGTGAIALPGLIGEASATGNLTQVGIKALQVAGKALWGAAKLGIILPLIGQMFIATAFQQTETPDTAKAKAAIKPKSPATKKVLESATKDLKPEDILNLYGKEAAAIAKRLKSISDNIHTEIISNTADSKEYVRLVDTKIQINRLQVQVDNLKDLFNQYVQADLKEKSSHAEQLDKSVKALKESTENLKID